MRVISSTGKVNWQRSRELLGIMSLEVPVPEEIIRLDTLSHEDEPLSNEATEWQIFDMQATPEIQEMAAVLTDMTERHRDFDHITPGLWNHPLSLTDGVVDKILLSLGCTRPVSEQLTAGGRVLQWP
ncbi:hypothetical protein MHL40_16845 [Pseudomonas luteola]|uniref:hypothetical protein n=1 Tax=Pseudomonas TaxID=286 RepID=UPI00030FFEF7|nr:MULTISPECIES: hypothetical protein [Pseudomonas]MCG7374323.1 hypothetical protein [Pseudomonas luteola]